MAKRIVEFIVAARNEKRITTTGELVSIIKKAIPAKGETGMVRIQQNVHFKRYALK